MDQWRSKFSESFSLDRYWSIESRLSFPATEPLDPRKVPEGFEKGVSERVSEGFYKGFARVLEGF